MILQNMRTVIKDAFFELMIWLKLDEAWFLRRRQDDEAKPGGKIRRRLVEAIAGRRTPDTALKRSTLLCYWGGCGLGFCFACLAIFEVGSMAVRETAYGFGWVSADSVYPTEIIHRKGDPEPEVLIRRLESDGPSKPNMVKMRDGRVIDFPESMTKGEIVGIMRNSYKPSEWWFFDPGAPVLELTLPGGGTMTVPEDTSQDKIRSLYIEYAREQRLSKLRTLMVFWELWIATGYLIAAVATFALGRAALYFVGGI
jgi:hypothetical protein